MPKSLLTQIHAEIDISQLLMCCCLFRQWTIEDNKPKADVCVVFLTISHWAVSAVLLLFILTFTLSRSHCAWIYHISYEVARQ